MMTVTDKLRRLVNMVFYVDVRNRHELRQIIFAIQDLLKEDPLNLEVIDYNQLKELHYLAKKMVDFKTKKNITAFMENAYNTLKDILHYRTKYRSLRELHNIRKFLFYKHNNKKHTIKHKAKHRKYRRK